MMTRILSPRMLSVKVSCAPSWPRRLSVIPRMAECRSLRAFCRLRALKDFGRRAGHSRQARVFRFFGHDGSLEFEVIDELVIVVSERDVLEAVVVVDGDS